MLHLWHSFGHSLVTCSEVVHSLYSIDLHIAGSSLGLSHNATVAVVDVDVVVVVMVVAVSVVLDTVDVVVVVGCLVA